MVAKLVGVLQTSVGVIIWKPCVSGEINLELGSQCIRKSSKFIDLDWKATNLQLGNLSWSLVIQKIQQETGNGSCSPAKCCWQETKTIRFVGSSCRAKYMRLHNSCRKRASLAVENERNRYYRRFLQFSVFWIIEHCCFEMIKKRIRDLLYSCYAVFLHDHHYVFSRHKGHVCYQTT